MRLQKLHPDITVLQARTFLMVAANPGTTQSALLKALNASDSAVSRAMATLSDLPPKAARMGVAWGSWSSSRTSTTGAKSSCT